MKLAYMIVTIGTPSILANGQVVFNITSNEERENNALTVIFPAGANVASVGRDAVLLAFQQAGYVAYPNGSNQVMLFLETTGDTITVSHQVSGGSSVGVTYFTQRVTLPRSTAAIAAAVAEAGVAQAQKSAAEAALLLAVGDDQQVASQLAQLSGQLAASQYEADELRLANAVLTANNMTLSQRVEAVAQDVSEANGRANTSATISALGVVVGVASALKVAAAKPSASVEKTATPQVL